MVAWGEAARIDVGGSARFSDAQEWFSAMASRAVVRDDVHVRGSGLVAFGSFSFADDSDLGGTLIVPQYILGRRSGLAWLTSISTSATITAPPP
jgi:menaquinone-specific isochorismate synthase